MTGATPPVPSRVLMVCLGNICRSPTAEGVLRQRLAAAGLGERIAVDSAGTFGGHAGGPPDARAIAHAARRGVDLRPLRARQVIADDFMRFDLVLAMDAANLQALRRHCPAPYAHKLGLLLEVALDGRPVREVPDPYYGEDADFERVLDLVGAACDALESPAVTLSIVRELLGHSETKAVGIM